MVRRSKRLKLLDNTTTRSTTNNNVVVNRQSNKSSTLADDCSRKSTLADGAEHVLAALSSGAIAFLALHDAVAALSSCRLLRHDAVLAIAALSYTDAGCHFLHKCGADWMSVPPPNAPKQLHEDLFVGECSSSTCRPHKAVYPTATTVAPVSPMTESARDWSDFDARNATSPTHSAHPLPRNNSSDTMNHALLSDPRISRDGSSFAAHVLSLVGMVQTRLLPLCYAFSSLNKFGDVCAARPVLLPLTRVQAVVDASASATNAPTDTNWTREDVRNALNAAWPQLGDEFTNTRNAFVLVSDVGAHWENITASRSRSSKRIQNTRCGFCDTAQQCVRTYKREARALLKQFHDALSVQKRQWRRDGLDAEEIHQASSELKAQFFPEDSYPDVSFADSHDDDVLADICESDRFPMDPFADMAAGFDRTNDDVFHALSAQYKHLCTTLYQPLHAALSAAQQQQQFVVVGQRVHRTWMDAHGDDDDSDNYSTLTSELVAGVSTRGVLCGVFISAKRADYEVPRSIVLGHDNDGDGTND